MKQAIMFGAGNIGRGFIGLLLEQAGYHVRFADVNMQIIDAINQHGSYTVHVVDEACTDIELLGSGSGWADRPEHPGYHSRRLDGPSQDRAGDRGGDPGAARSWGHGAAEHHRL